MPIDPYSPCPGGLGKKVKFCCHDLVHELDKIDHMRAADQRAACLDYVEKLDAKHPGRACLMTAKADLLRDLGRADEASAMVKTMLGQNAANPVALAEAAILACDDDDVASGGALLQQAFAMRADTIPAKLVEALVRVAERLLSEGELLAARSHFALYLALVREDENVSELFMRIDSTPTLSPLLKQDRPFLPTPDGVAWGEEFEAAKASVSRAAWGEAANRLDSLAAGVGQDSPAVWHNLALLRSWLGHNEAACVAWRRYAEFEMPQDDAVETEALAQLLDTQADRIDVLLVTQPIHDMDRLMEILASDRRFRAAQVPSAAEDPDSPPPRAIFLFSDRPLPAADAPLELATLPRHLAQVMVFGRQTDREARLEVVVQDGQAYEQVQQIIGEFSFGLLGPATEELLHQESLIETLLRGDWQMPVESSYADQMRLRGEYLEETFFRRWPEMTLKSLDGQTPRQAAKGDRHAQRKVLAALLNLELACQAQMAAVDFNRLRRELGLPEVGTIEIGDRPIYEIPLARWHRINMANLSDALLTQLVESAAGRGISQAVRNACQEIVRRPASSEGIPKAAAYGQLAALSSDATESIEYLDKARQEAEAAGQSTARWDLQEVQYRLQRQEPEEVMRLINHVAQEHSNEPGVRQALMGLMVQLGLLRPDGSMPQQREAMAGLAPAAAEEPGKLWTPESARGGSGEKPSLWLPGS